MTSPRVIPAFPILSSRFSLIPLTPACLGALLAGDLVSASSLIEATIPPAAAQSDSTYLRRLHQLRANPSLQPWLLRAIVLRETGEMIGRIGFHDAPGAEYLRDYAPHGLEFGYEVYPASRRQGYASEACRALMDWAHHAGGVSRFVASISPHNAPSLAMAEKFGYRRVGQHLDEEDGEEYIFALDYPVA